MKKVIICIPSLATGGAERFVVDLASRIDKKKYEVVVAVTRNMERESFLTKNLANREIRIADLSSSQYLSMLRKQIAFLRSERPDVVHANIGSILHVMLACELCKIPVRLYTVHNEAKLLFGNSRVKKFTYGLAFSLFKFVPVAICPTVKKTIIEAFGISPDKIPVVNNGVDTKRFVPSEARKDAEQIRIISVGTLYWIKNHEMTINAVCDMREKGIDVSLEIIGDGEDREKLEQVIKNRQAEKYVILQGIKANVEEYLQNADIYVSSSKTEGLPLSILEAMACGLPIVATDVGGTRDIVCEGKNGFLIPIGDEKYLEKKLTDLATDKNKRKCFSQNSRNKAEEWCIQNCIEGYESLYEKK